MRPTSLHLRNVPLRSSNLAIPPSPFSPRSPTTPQFSRPLHPQPRIAHSTTQPTISPPAPPRPWLWQCHICRRGYSLGTTRRCLEDGHYFCSFGTSANRARRGLNFTKRHFACASQFDYHGWIAWGDWRRGELQSRAELSGQVGSRALATGRDCGVDCDFPRNCSWRAWNVGREMEGNEDVKEMEIVSPTPAVPLSTSTTILTSVAAESLDHKPVVVTPILPAPPRTFDGILRGIEASKKNQPGKSSSDDIWSLLASSTARRKHIKPSVQLPPPLRAVDVGNAENIFHAVAAEETGLQPPAPVYQGVRRQTSFEVLSVRKVATDPLVARAPEPAFTVSRGSGVAGFEPLGNSCQVSSLAASPGGRPSAERAQSYVERLRRSTTMHLIRSKSA